MDILTPKEKNWLKRNAQYFKTKPVNVKVVGDSQPDIAFSHGTILLGRRFLNDKPDSARRKKKLTHEMIHAAGYPHDQKMRDLGYYSSPRKDRFSERVVKDIEGGAKMFNIATIVNNPLPSVDELYNNLREARNNVILVKNIYGENSQEYKDAKENEHWWDIAYQIAVSKMPPYDKNIKDNPRVNHKYNITNIIIPILALAGLYWFNKR